MSPRALHPRRGCRVSHLAAEFDRNRSRTPTSGLMLLLDTEGDVGADGQASRRNEVRAWITRIRAKPRPVAIVAKWFAAGHHQGVGAHLAAGDAACGRPPPGETARRLIAIRLDAKVLARSARKRGAAV